MDNKIEKTSTSAIDSSICKNVIEISQKFISMNSTQQNFQVSCGVGLKQQPDTSSKKTKDELFISMKPEELIFEREDWLGGGSSGDVYSAIFGPVTTSATSNPNLDRVAVKVIPKQTFSDAVNMQHEVELLKYVDFLK